MCSRLLTKVRHFLLRERLVGGFCGFNNGSPAQRQDAERVPNKAAQPGDFRKEAKKKKRRVARVN